ncbi:hypothetical protein BIV57_15170 [Mangrovactinospora gilvigrisea]|uniref:Penicillin-insensitive transglycosylase n=1 Tax=Mangrovactinospora gilvigrisea TaxID=1428644 RepID=A0A1J7BT49_9ACTN|nr:transglycosylase domain-containing protein [Mangrovactinospora gilvigrisea]OIV36641.1 hypothetical protein BIV57_15170 [Mangrovactinospora gilvigrisea]
MSTTSPTDRPRRRSGLRRLLPTWRMVLGAAVLVVLLLGGAFALAWYTIGIPQPNANVQQQNNTWLYRDGSLIATTGPVNRENITIGQIPASMRHATVAAENRSFYRDPGIDPLGLARGVFRTVFEGAEQGGSTITQQYVKNYYLDQSRTVSRKVKELFIAMKVDRRMSKDQILAGYLNTSFFGRNAYGVQAAARAYYHTDAKHLTVGQSAYLAALLNQPSRFDVSTDSKADRRAALDRWNWVLDGMVDQHWLSPAARAKVKFPQPYAPQPPNGLGGQAGYLVMAARDDLLSHHTLTEAQLDAGGWRITTTFDKDRTAAMATAVQHRLSDQLDPKHRKADRDVLVGGASIDPKTGQVVALHGGTSYLKQWRSSATTEDYQVGSTFKPIVLAAALAEHARTQDGTAITPNTYYSGRSRRDVQGLPAHTKPYAPPNEGDRSYGEITVQEAMDKSVNAVYAQLAVDAGLGNVADLAKQLGLQGVHAVPSVALGVSAHSPLDMASVYATLDDHGVRIAPWTVLKVRRSTGEHPVLPKHPGTRVLTAKVADQVTQVLRGVIDDPGGTGYAAQHLDRPAAGKTGTTDDFKSVWFTGYTPQLATSIGMFGWDAKAGRQVSLDNLAGNGQAAGGTFPAQVWTDYMRAALKGEPVLKFPKNSHGHGGSGGGWTPTATASAGSGGGGGPTSHPTPTSRPTPSTIPTPTLPPPTSAPPTGPPTGRPTPTLPPPTGGGSPTYSPMG